MDQSKSVETVKRAFLKLGSDTNKVWNKSVRNVQKGVENMQKGMENSVNAVKKLKNTEKLPDVETESEEEALDMLKKMVETAASEPQKRPEKWEFKTVPLACFNKTLDDIFMAFVRWAKPEDSLKINVSRAFSRLEAYATWMDNSRGDLVEPALTTDSIKEAWKIWNIKVSYDKAGHLVWWLDLSELDLQKVKSIPPAESLRLFVWFSHFVMLDPHSQQNGCVLVQNLSKVQMWTGVTLVPPKLAHKLDRLTIGTIPVKMKQIYICESPQWAQVLLSIMKPFLSPIVKNRIVFLEKPKVLEDILGLDCIPASFVGTDGKLEKDIVWAAFSMD